MNELERLKADLEVIERYNCKAFTFAVAKAEIESKIARLEAEVDPWRDARVFANEWRDASPNDYPINTAAAKCFDRMIAKVEAQKKQLDYLHAEYENRGLQISELVADNDRLEKRVAELEAEPEFTPAVLKRAKEIVVGDIILGGGMIRVVDQIAKSAEYGKIQLCGDGWGTWHKPMDLVAVLPKPLVDAKTAPLKGDKNG